MVNVLITLLVAGDLALLLAYYREVKDNQRLQAANDYLTAEVMDLHLRTQVGVVRESEDGEG